MTNHPNLTQGITAKRPVILVGNPNVGKSAIFAAFTGRRVDISNYPGTTVELTYGEIVLDGQPFDLIDTPGTQSLLPRSEDERVARDILLAGEPWAVLQVADAKNLRRSLMLALQVAEFDLPLVIALNMSDEALALGLAIDSDRLAQKLGTTIVPTVAVQQRGLEALKSALEQPAPPVYRIRYEGAIEAAIMGVSQMLPDNLRGQRGIALALLAGDTALYEWLALPWAEQNAIETIVAETTAQYDQPLGYMITRQRLKCADCLLEEVIQAPVDRPVSANEKLGLLMVHPIWGWPFLALVLLGLYWFVGHLGAGIMVDWVESVFFGEWVNPLAIRAAAAIPNTFIRDFLVGDYGLVTMALSYAIAIVLPIVFTFFLAFSLLEDSGYLPRLAVMANRPFKAMGLNGKAVLPMVLGLGCDTMATLTTRILETRKERLQVTLLLALGVPCSAQLGVLMGMVAILTGPAVLVWLGVVVGTLFAVGWLSARILPGKSSEFILELPPVRRPQLSSILIKTVARIEWYLKEVLPLFIAGTAILFVLDKLQILATLERLGAPLVSGLLGLPGETAGIFVIGFLRRDFGAAGLFDMARDGLLTANQLVVSLVVITLFIPCIANLLMIFREHGRRTALYVALFVFPFAFAVGGALNGALNWLGIQF